ncbi:2-C-methyl-D-erythritol 4-phosphate cytidylyltransferase [Vibrio sp. S4B1]|nr:2-C-methyl-D-erythritol 4-phosphate cytidylyltransferase [Vibrio methylphosphonaticus]MCL9773436.1 2-C-methyl-D-erythritol 4-phosphate cytidylyltransferase [Vibrio methylphosphonaticus]
MQADKPKQYLPILGKTILEHTVTKLLAHPRVSKVIVAVSENDPYYPTLAIASHPDVQRVSGGKERADSVLSALNWVQSAEPEAWCLVHDAARPCVCLDDITTLIQQVVPNSVGGILAMPVKDTMKRANAESTIAHTEDRNGLWHALTPQLFSVQVLHSALSDALKNDAMITDEASAIERVGQSPKLVEGRGDNIKVTRPEDLALAEFYLLREEEHR